MNSIIDNDIERLIISLAVKKELHKSCYIRVTNDIKRYILSIKKRIKDINKAEYIEMFIDDLGMIVLDINIKNGTIIFNKEYITSDELYHFIEYFSNDCSIVSIKEKLNNNETLTDNDYEFLEKELMIKKDYISN